MSHSITPLRGRRDRKSPDRHAETDAYATVQTLLAFREVAGQQVDAGAESRAILAARRLTWDLLGTEPDLSVRLHLVDVLDVLDFWLDGCTRGQVHAQWQRIAASSKRAG